jgi:hypothetical protein
MCNSNQQDIAAALRKAQRLTLLDLLRYYTSVSTFLADMCAYYKEQACCLPSSRHKMFSLPSGLKLIDKRGKRWQSVALASSQAETYYHQVKRGTTPKTAPSYINVIYAAFLLNALRPKLRFVSIIGFYAWGGKTVGQLAGMIPNLNDFPPDRGRGCPGQ